ncbi:hypothetical protein [Phycobacter azelaicus]|uniref:hypothetical protein n=1 Tax=Phycobacter azelaicus TaxID=2668075 RepID=UPI0018695F1C|nr:hypothetical protein [Phycobacter azelaicus]MBE1297858.1 hypothetical protein [Paracoccaceae bacterium]
MLSPQQNVGHSAAAARPLASQDAQKTNHFSSDKKRVAAHRSKARALYDSVSHLSRRDAIDALFQMSHEQQLSVHSSDYQAYSSVIRLVGTEGEMENRKKEAKVASNVLFELLEELPTATEERLAVLRSEIVTLGGFADQAQNRVEVLKAHVAEMIADL